MAANPVIIDIPVGQWTKFADSVTDAVVNVHPKYLNTNYVYTYRPSGGAAPDAADREDEGVPVFDNGAPHPVASRPGENIDGYLWCDQAPGRVILWN